MDEKLRALKPTDWPQNARECALANIADALEEFLKKPNYRTKEVLVSLVCHHDLNQDSQIGFHRITEYEVHLINFLYVHAGVINLNCLKTYLYNTIHKLTRSNLIISKMLNSDPEIEAYAYLVNPLKLYYYACLFFYLERKRTFAEHLEKLVTHQLGDGSDEENVFYTTQSYITLLNDISYFTSKRITPLWAFTREELMRLFGLAAKLVKMDNEDPIVSPLKGVLMTMISNYVLKSRTNYNEDYICKYVSSEIALASITNHQIWMRGIRQLNDEREMAVIPELFLDSSWIGKEWVTEIDFKPRRTYYVSSFSKDINNENMKREYGECVYGYKDDRIISLIAPIHFYKDSTFPCLSQVIAFDVLYDLEDAKKEIIFLCNIIDLFSMTSHEKKMFLEEIMQYWLLSVKDEKWKEERERRYTIFMYDSYKYKEIDISDTVFLKIKTSMFLFPDFVLGDNPAKPYVKRCIDEKRTANSVKNYLFCKDCFNRNYDYLSEGADCCSICGSRNIQLVEK